MDEATLREIATDYLLPFFSGARIEQRAASSNQYHQLVAFRDHLTIYFKVNPQSDYIDKYGEGAHYHLLDELEKSILSELRRALEGADADEENVRRSTEIMMHVAKVTSDTEKLSGSAIA